MESHAGLQGQSQFQQSQAQQQPALQHAQSGPPYIFNPKVTYSDPNVQAWAQYYAQGGRDLAGAVYFVSIPGLTDTPPKSPNATGFPVQQGQGQEVSLQTLNPQNVGSTDSLSLQMKSQQTQPHGAQVYQPSQGAENNTTPGYGISSSPTLQPQQHPAQQSASNNALPIAVQSTPQATPSTPAWVLPKKTDLKPEAAGSSSHSLLPGQFSGMNITDPTNGTQP
jgi:signal transducing adaptor molecule